MISPFIRFAAAGAPAIETNVAPEKRFVKRKTMNMTNKNGDHAKSENQAIDCGAADCSIFERKIRTGATEYYTFWLNACFATQRCAMVITPRCYGENAKNRYQFCVKNQQYVPAT